MIAERIGFAPRGGLSAVERFMKAYFLIAKDVGDLTAIVCAELEARQAKRRPVLDRMLGRFRRRRGGASRAADFIVDNDRINVADEDAFAAIPSISSACSGSPTGTTCRSIPTPRAWRRAPCG